MTEDQSRHFSDLNSRFQEFLQSLPESECIDHLTLTDEQKTEAHADYFFQNREIICELKTLEIDPKYRQEAAIDRLRERPEWPLIFGRVGLGQVLERFPDREAINKEIVLRVSDPIETLVRKANKQLRQTKKVFNLTTSAGVLIILNETSYTLAPDVIIYRLGQLFKKKSKTGQPRFSDIAAAILITTAHFVDGGSGIKSLPIFAVSNVQAPDSKAIDFCNWLMPSWAQSQGVDPIPHDWGELRDKFRRSSEER